MAKKLPRSIVRPADTQVDGNDELLKTARARFGSTGSDRIEGGAWAQAGASVMANELDKLHAERIRNLLSGDLVFELEPDQIIDEVGSDRTNSWKEDPTFAALKASIELNGQDVPVQVAPLKGQWEPVFDEANGILTQGLTFKIIGGRRRLEAIRQLGKKVRTVCISLDAEEPAFDQLHRRFRENAERENLSLFDELLAVGEMFSHAKTLESELTGRAFAKKIGIAEPKVSRGRAIFENRARIEAELEAPHKMTLHELDRLIPALRNGADLPIDSGGSLTAPPSEKSATPKRYATQPTVKRTQIIKGRKIVAKCRMGKITLDLGGDAEIDETFLDRLLLFIQQNANSEK